MASKLRSYWKSGTMNFYDHKGHPAWRFGLWANCPTQAIKCDPQLAHVFFTDFFEHTNSNAFHQEVFPTAEAPAGTDGIEAGIGGWYKTFADADNNDECYEASTGESWLFASGKKMWFECSLKLSEGNTNKANWIIGFMDLATSAVNGENSLLDNGAGPAASYDGAVFYKVDGTMKTYFETSNANTQATATEMGTFTTAVAQRLGFYFDGTATTSTITPYIDGVAGTAQTITLSGLAEMDLFFGVKAGGGTPEEALEVDWIKVVQLK